LPEQIAAVKAAHPRDRVEVWSFDEHRIGLQPILRRVWAPKGCGCPQGATCLVEPRYQWLYLYGFVRPEQGETMFLTLPKANTACFNQALLDFAQAVQAGVGKQVILVIDGASWHRSRQVVLPPGVHLLLLPPYSPELQPAERLWPLTNETLANRHFATLAALEAVQLVRCQIVQTLVDEVRALTAFQWWLDALIS
jgi:transposase